MPSSAMLVVQDAVRVALEGDAGFTTPVLDYVPDTQAFPYVKVGETTERPDPRQDREGWDLTVTVHVFSQHKGWGEAKQIVDELCRVLHRALLPLEDGTMWRLTYDNAWTLEEYAQGSSILTRHIPVQFRVGVEA